MSKAFSGNFRIEIFDRRHDTLDARGDQSVSARRSAAVVCVWFERNIGSAATCFLAREIERDSFRMLDRFEDVETFANNLPTWTHNNTTDEWSRTYLPDSFLRQLQRTTHHASISLGPGCYRFS